MFYTLSRHSTTLQQWRRHAEALNTVQDRGEQLMWHRDFGHLKSHVLGVPDYFGRFLADRLYAPHRVNTRKSIQIAFRGLRYQRDASGRF